MFVCFWILLLEVLDTPYISSKSTAINYYNSFNLETVRRTRVRWSSLTTATLSCRAPRQCCYIVSLFLVAILSSNRLVSGIRQHCPRNSTGPRACNESAALGTYIDGFSSIRIPSGRQRYTAHIDR
ncbi:hypothetical protein PF005_g20923 [Phytophthora fragariae]|uniref:Secreted protein n=1 Tax=Phytophthora fragariae TaxID=53985 RepID=A0A6A3WJK7_9STRA|nr:hypothetical protein PF003_g9424 [Phytophthora fragariae]KAE8927926.1 hypothetical protein PF009_g21919 [Phytophthora fragariae]KAE8987419.1 hypothetical protein PF011_g19587 [Phytophthora fragariae]KAE9086010.1 hypothetical protein PF007_g20939 [Phytophthora fragariae]KAE9086142.1 hypothetical protein PF010_g20205 [Phytophthora fragariae]